MKGRKLALADPLTYGVFTDDELTAKKPACSRNIAVLIAHGMGQQSKFDTLDQVARGLDEQHQVEKVARNVRIGDQSMSRIEMPLTDDGGQAEAHVYEAYWAPMTEGVITLPEVIAFLKNAFWNGIRYSREPFRRWLFDKYQRPAGRRPGFRTGVYFLLTLLVLLALIFMNSITVAIGTANVMAANMQPQKGAASWMQDATVDDLTLIALMFCAIGGIFGLTILACGKQKELSASKKLPLASRLGYLYFFFVVLATISAGAMMMATVAYHRSSHWFLRGCGTSFAAGAIVTMLVGSVILLIAAVRAASSRVLIAVAAGAAFLLTISLAYAAAHVGQQVGQQTSVFVQLGAWTKWFESSALAPYFAVIKRVSQRWIAVWALLLYVSRKVRGFLLQFVGDVAIYITPQTLDRFNDVRERIKDCVQKVAETVYRARDEDGKLLYGRVIVIGHSLGSVIVYDTLNKLLNLDAYAGGALRVADRTPRLITFGSPLDKTAYLFSRSTQRVGMAARAALAATVQPLVADEEVRMKIKWQNVWSPLDIFSGELNFYEPDPSAGEQFPPEARVDNQLEWAATKPIAAHTEYWDKKLVWKLAHEAMLPSRLAALAANGPISSNEAPAPPPSPRPASSPGG